MKKDEFVSFVEEQIRDTGLVTSRAMFSGYQIYVNGKPMILIIDDVAYVKPREELAELLADADKDKPFPKASPWYILDVENRVLCEEVIAILKPITDLPKKKKNSAEKSLLDRIPKPAKRALENAGLTTEAALTEATDQELLHLHGFGPKALKIIREALET